ncbi:hypothetical protein Csa_021412 [Cucumis sativus]|nr:hypothetical protein Csa_021412 [Cucumis sativus]
MLAWRLSIQQLGMLQRFPRAFFRLASPLLQMGHRMSYSTYASHPPLSDLHQTMPSVQFISLPLCCYLMGLFRNIDTLIKFHGLLIVHGLIGNLLCDTKLVGVYGALGDVRSARMVFDQMPNPDFYAWKVMIRQPNDGLRLFADEIRSDLLPNSVTAASVLSACSVSGNLNLGMSVHGLGIKIGLEECVVKNALIDMYAKCHKIGDAYAIFHGVLEKDVITWNSMISGYAQNGSAYDALRLFNQMRSYSLAPDAITLVSTLSASATLGAIQVGSSLHAYSVKGGLFSSNLYIGTALLNFYAKCGDARSARMVFDSMGVKNIITWSAMIGGYGVQDFIKKMPVQPDVSLYGAFLHGCGLYSRFDLGEVVVREMLQLHRNEACYYVLVSNLYASDGKWGQVNEVRDLMLQRGLNKVPGYSLVETNADILYDSWSPAMTISSICINIFSMLSSSTAKGSFAVSYYNWGRCTSLGCFKCSGYTSAN